MSKNAIILISETSYPLAQTIKENLAGTSIYTQANIEGTERFLSINQCVKQLFDEVDALIFIGSVGVCVRSIAPYVNEQKNPPATICLDTAGRFVISLMSGNVGGANALAKRIANIVGGEAVITTPGDSANLWSLGTIGTKFGWEVETNTANMNYPATSFVNKNPTALLLDINDEGTRYMERTAPEHVDIYYKYSDIDARRYELLLAVTPYIYPETGIQTIYYRPKILHLGLAARNSCEPTGIVDYLSDEIKGLNIATLSIKSVTSVELDNEEVLLKEIQATFPKANIQIYNPEELKDFETIIMQGKEEEQQTEISELSALKSAGKGKLILARQKSILSYGNEFTFSIAIEVGALRQGQIEYIGTGPGDPDLISVKGKYLIEAADLIIFPERVVPTELALFAKEGALVRNENVMPQEELLQLIEDFYKKGKIVACLCPGNATMTDNMRAEIAFFTKNNIPYRITPGIS